jgi:S1-C subfamily serine protease
MVNAMNPTNVMHWTGRLALVCGCLVALSASPGLRAEDSDSAAARKVFTEKQDSVVWLSAVAKIALSAEGGRESVNIPDQETKVEALGTIIDPSGLVVAALSQVDPARRFSGREVRRASGNIKLEAVATLKEFKVIMPDGTEIPGEIIMKDPDLDLAFIRIKTASKEAKGVVFHAIDLKDNAPGKVLDEVVTISRMDEVLNRAPTVSRGQVTMLTKKPREFLRVEGSSPGCPTFLIDGKVLGITVIRTVRNRSSAEVVIPAADVLEIADQAKAAKPAEEKKTKVY